MYIRYSREKLQEKNKIPHFLQLWDKSSQENKNWRPEGVFTLFRINTLYVNTECLCLSFVNIYFLYCRGSGKILNFLWFGFPYFSSLNWTVNRAERPLCIGNICTGTPGTQFLHFSVLDEFNTIKQMQRFSIQNPPLSGQPCQMLLEGKEEVN